MARLSNFFNVGVFDRNRFAPGPEIQLYLHICVFNQRKCVTPSAPTGGVHMSRRTCTQSKRAGPHCRRHHEETGLLVLQRQLPGGDVTARLLCPWQIPFTNPFRLLFKTILFTVCFALFQNITSLTRPDRCIRQEKKPKNQSQQCTQAFD